MVGVVGGCVVGVVVLGTFPSVVASTVVDTWSSRVVDSMVVLSSTGGAIVLVVVVGCVGVVPGVDIG